MSRNTGSADQPPTPASEPVAAPATDEGGLRFHVPPEDVGARLDKFLAGRPEVADRAVSRTRLRALIEAGAAGVEGVVCVDPARRLAAGQSVWLEVPPPLDPVPRGQKIPLSVAYEDRDLIVIDKPPGLVVHPAAGHADGTLVNALIAHCGDSLSGVGGVARPGIVHRLDKDTSGLLVVAKNDFTHHGLARQFADHGRTMDFSREYIALVWGAPPLPSGTVDRPLGRSQQNARKMAITHAGKEAVTHWRREAVYGADREGAPLLARLRCALETGRTHQIRVHMASLGHPIVGDSVYGSGFRTKAALAPPRARAKLEAFSRQALHAARLAFVHPRSGELLDFSSEPPRDMARLFKELEALPR